MLRETTKINKAQMCLLPIRERESMHISEKLATAFGVIQKWMETRAKK